MLRRCPIRRPIGLYQQRRGIAIASDTNIFNYRAVIDENDGSTALSKSSSDGPLAAWPISIKDNICTTDMPTTCSSKMLEGYMSPFDATVVSLLRSAGVDIVGKTNCDEFGMGSANINSAFGPVVNPRSREEDVEVRVAGGSSGGAAASVAAHLCRAAIGSDTGGSVRLPAAYCGVYGFKPSYGLISRWGLVAYADSLDTIGIVAGKGDDLRSVFDVLAKHDEKDSTSIPDVVRRRAERIADSALSNVATSKASLKGLRIGVPQEIFPQEVNPRVMDCFRDALSLLKDRGASIVPVHIPSVEYALSAYYVLSCAEASSNLARFDGVRYGFRATDVSETGQDTTSPYPRGIFSEHIARSRSLAFGEEVRTRIMLGTYALTSDLFDNYFVQAQRIRALLRRDYDATFCVENPLRTTEPSQRSTSDGVHALLHPSAVDIAPTMKEAQEKGTGSYLQDLLTVPASLAGLPAVSIPVGEAEGMPVGVTLTTQWGCEPILWRVLKVIGP